MVALFALALTAPAFADNFEGDKNDNTISGTDDRDRILGRGGNDKLYGFGGPDRILGGFGNDLIVGGFGEDFLAGGPGDDVIYTGTETQGDKASDEYTCGDGYDIVYVSGQDHASHNNEGDNCEEIRHY